MNSEKSFREVSDTVARIAAALYLGDTRRAEKALDEQRKEWMQDGADQERRARERRVDSEAELMGQRQVVFETRDGVIGKDVIPTTNEILRFYKRPCMNAVCSIGFAAEDPYKLMAVETRTYRHDGERNRFGFPIYKEVP